MRVGHLAGVVKRRGPAAIGVCLALAFAPDPALSCSVTFTEPRDPAVRYAGTSVRRLVGTYRMEGVAVPGGLSTPALIHGRLMTRRGRIFPVVQEYREQLVDCAVYDLPTGDAKGLFYLSRRKRDGRYRLLGWRGTHIPGMQITRPVEEGDE